MKQSAFQRVAIEASTLLLTLHVLIGVLCGRPVMAAAPGADTVVGLHIQLKDTALSDVYEKVFADEIEICTFLKRSVEPLPAGAKVQETSFDRYYVPGAVTTYIVSKTYSYPINQSCKLVQRTEEKITIEVTGGFCNANPQKMVAVGKCKIPLAQLSQRLTRLRLPFAGVATGQTRVIAGEGCAVYEQDLQKILWRWCFAKKEFAGGLATGVSGAPGAPLSEKVFSGNDPSKPMVALEAIKIEDDTPIPVNILLPQLFGNYRLMGG